MPSTEVVVTLKAPPLASFGRALASADARTYERRLAAARAQAEHNVLAAVPSAQIRWRYRIVADGFAVVVPSSEVARLAHVPGVDRVWPNVTYHALLNRSPQVIGADKLWGPTFATAGNGMKIGIIDDGLDATHPFLEASGFAYPAGFPKGQTQFATPKVIVQRAFPPPSTTWKYASRPFDPDNSFHATHVAGIAAGNHGTSAAGTTVSGVAPNAYLGNYKALTVPTPDFGLDGNAAEIAAAIEAAVSDGMNVINLSLGEPEVEPSRDLVVAAIDAAAAAGVVPVVAAGNDFGDFGFGTVSSPGSAPGAITVAAATKTFGIADFSSGGPTPVSLQLKPDVSAPGVQILSSVPASRGTWGVLQGTSMASPHVAGGAALLKERHPTWTPAQVKSALVSTGAPVREGVNEVPTTREGGGMIDLAKADNPLVFTDPSSLTFPVNGGTRTVTLTDAGGGADTWTVAASVQPGSLPATISAPSTVTVPGSLTVTATAGAQQGDVTGFVVLTRGTDVRHIPFWLEVSHPVLAGERHIALTKPGVYKGTTRGGASRVSDYRYPTIHKAGPEVVYRVTVRGNPANFGVAVVSGTAVPLTVFAGDENHLAGYTALPSDFNPYRATFGRPRPISGVVLPAPGAYDVVFDTTTAAAAGPFTFRYWVNDVTPPTISVAAAKNRRIAIKLTDAGAGVDPAGVFVTVDGRFVNAPVRNGLVSVPASAGTHRVVVRAADYQETKNMEDVVKILPNTATKTVTVRVK